MAEIHELLNSDSSRAPKFRLLGKAFFGKRLVSKKDGSFATTLWMTFCFLPIIPYESYRVLNPYRIFLHRVFGFDDYIFYRCIKTNFDWRQVITTLLASWGFLLVYFYAAIVLSLQFGMAVGYWMIAAATIATSTSLGIHYFRYINPKNTTAVGQSNGGLSQGPQGTVSSSSQTATPTKPSLPTSFSVPEVAPPVLPHQAPNITPHTELPHVEAAPKQAPAGSVQPPKFDPNKVMEWWPDVDVKVRYEELEDRGELGLAGWLGILNVILLFSQLLLEFYYAINLEASGWLFEYYRILQHQAEFYLLNITAIIFAVLVSKKAPSLTITLIVLSIALAFNLHQYLFDLLINYTGVK